MIETSEKIKNDNGHFSLSTAEDRLKMIEAKLKRFQVDVEGGDSEEFLLKPINVAPESPLTGGSASNSVLVSDAKVLREVQQVRQVVEQCARELEELGVQQDEDWRRGKVTELVNIGVPTVVRLAEQTDGIKKACVMCLSPQARRQLEERQAGLTAELTLLSQAVFTLKDSDVHNLKRGRLGHPRIINQNTKMYFDYLVVGSYACVSNKFGQKASNLFALMKSALQDIVLGLDNRCLQDSTKQALFSRHAKLRQRQKCVSLPAYEWVTQCKPKQVHTFSFKAVQQMVANADALVGSWHLEGVKLNPEEKIAYKNCLTLVQEVKVYLLGKREGHMLMEEALGDLLEIIAQCQRRILGTRDVATFRAASEALISKASQLERHRSELKKSVTRGREHFLQQLCFETQCAINQLSCMMLEYHQACLVKLVNLEDAEGQLTNEDLKKLCQLMGKSSTKTNEVRANIKALSTLATQWWVTSNQQEFQQLRGLLAQEGLGDAQTKVIKHHYSLQSEWHAELEQFFAFWQSPVDEQVDNKIVEQIASLQRFRFKRSLLFLHRSQMSQFKIQEDIPRLEADLKVESEGWSNSKAKKEADILKLEVEARRMGVQRKKQELEDVISRAQDQEASAVFLQGQEKAILKFETQKKREWMEMSRLYDMAILECTQAKEEQGKYEKLKRQRDLEDEIFEREEKDNFNSVLSTELTEISRWKEELKEKDMDHMNVVMFEQVEHIRIKREKKEKRHLERQNRLEQAQASADQFNRQFEQIRQPHAMWRLPKHWYSKPHIAPVRLEVVDGKYVIRWESSKKTVDHTQFFLSRTTTLEKGFANGKIPKSIPAAVHKYAFSLESPSDSIVLCPLDQDVFDLWFSFLENSLVAM